LPRVSSVEGALISFIVLSSLGRNGEWHPTPTRQWAVVLSGSVEMTVGDEEVRVFGPGDVVLLDDTGRGHLTNVVSPEGVTATMVPSRPE